MYIEHIAYNNIARQVFYLVSIFDKILRYSDVVSIVQYKYAFLITTEQHANWEMRGQVITREESDQNKQQKNCNISRYKAIDQHVQRGRARE